MTTAHQTPIYFDMAAAVRSAVRSLLKPTRRRLLAAAAAGTAASLTEIGRASAHDDGSSHFDVSEPWLSGSIVAISPLAAVVRTVDRDVVVSLHPDATFSRDGDTRLEAFLEGDQVALLLAAPGEPFIAVRMVTRYQLFTGTVTERTTDWMRCTGGTVLIDETTTAHRAGRRYPKIELDEIRVGDYVGVTSRFESRVGAYYAREIALYR